MLLVADQLLDDDDDVCVSLDSLIALDVLDDHSVGVLLDCTVDVDDEDDEGENDDDDDEGDVEDDGEERLLEESAEVEDEDDDEKEEEEDVDDELLLTEVDTLDKIEDELGTSTSSSARSSVFVHNRAKP